MATTPSTSKQPKATRAEAEAEFARYRAAKIAGFTGRRDRLAEWEVFVRFNTATGWLPEEAASWPCPRRTRRAGASR